MKFNRVLIFYLLSFSIFTLIYLFLFRTKIFLSDYVLFYRGIKLLIISTVVTLLISLLIKKNINISWETIFAATLIVLFFHLTFFTLFPVTFERSVTMYLLETIKNNQGINKQKLEKKLIDEYIIKNQALEKRLFEQKTTGFIEVRNNKVYLNQKGELFLKFSQLIKSLFRIEK